MDSASEATASPGNVAVVPDKEGGRATRRMWVDGHLVVGDAEISTALKLRRARTKEQLPATLELPTKITTERLLAPAAKPRIGLDHQDNTIGPPASPSATGRSSHLAAQQKPRIAQRPRRAPSVPSATIPSAARKPDLAEKNASPEALAKIAAKLVIQLRVQEAIEIYQSIIHVESIRAEANAGLGWCYLHIRDYEQSIQYFEKSLDAHPEFGRALYGAGISLLELGRLSEAASYGRRLAGLPSNENRARGLYVLGLVDRARGAWDEAVAHLEESLQTHPHNRVGSPSHTEIRHRYELALCYRELNRHERALEHLGWAAHHEKRPGPIALDLAKLYLELERFDEAESRFKSVLKHSPQSQPALIGIGRVYIGNHEYSRAIQSFSSVLSRARDDLDALNGMAECYKELGHLDRAARYLERIDRRYKAPPTQSQLENRLRSLENERTIRDAELLRMRNIAALNIMATGIAHELRQPLTLIRLAAQNARRDIEKGIAKNVTADLEDIDGGVIRLDRIIAVLQDAASDEVATDEIVALDHTIDAAMSLFRAQLAHREITITLENVNNVFVVGSRTALQQVLINLISNARDALVESLTKKIVISAVEDGNKVRIEVSDTGCGMSEAVRERALDPFYTTKKNGGTGLGLYICHNLLRRMNASVRIKETSVGRGTTFEIELQRAKGSEHG